MEKVHWKVEGMTCANCALTINKYLEKKGMQNIKINPIDGDVSFEEIENTPKEILKKDIHDLGYEVVDDIKDTNKSEEYSMFRLKPRVVPHIEF